MTRAIFTGTILFFVALHVRVTLAQEPNTKPDSSQTDPAAPLQTTVETEPVLVRPPQLKKQVSPQLPQDAVFPGPEVAVVLEIEVDETGKVKQVQLQAGAGEPFDQAALEAGRQFEFEPALLSNGQATAVTISFRLRMQRPTLPPEKPATVPTLSYQGTLLERGTRKPLQSVEVSARFGDKLLASSVTDESGHFALEVPAIEFELVAYPAGHEPLLVAIEGAPGEQREEIFYLERAASGYETVVRAARVRREVTKQVIPKEVVESVAGTQGDTLKVVQNLPGVGRASFGAGALILRGASPGDSAIFLEGQEIPLLYHFGGLRSSFNSVFLDSVEFVPGNFGPDYGRATGGVVDIKVRDPAKDLFRGQLDFNFYDAGFAVEGPIGGDWSMGGAFHRSYIDTLLPLFLPKDSPISFNTAPRYYDYQLLATWNPDADRKLRFFLYGSMDTVRLLFSRPQSDPLVRGNLDARLMFHNLQASYRHRLSPVLVQESSAMIGLQQIHTIIGPQLFFDLNVLRLSLRSTWEWQSLSWLTVRMGLDWRLQFVGIDLNSPLRPIEGEQSSPASTNKTYVFKNDTVLYQPALFVEGSFKPHKTLLVIPSLRLDWYRDIQRWTLDPRLNIRYQMFSDTSLKAGIGWFQQPPTPDQTVKTLGNPQLHALRSSHSSVGIEQGLFDIVEMEITGFYKWLDRLVVRSPGAAYDAQLAPYQSAGTGRIFGVEVLIKPRLGERFTGWISYTYQRSFRKDSSGSAERLFDFDQPHILTAVASMRIGWGVSAGLRFRLVSGTPGTPVATSIYDANSGTYVPVYGTANSDRLETFHQLDLRVDKLWTFKTWKLNLYLDIQNVYNHGNQEGWSYSFDYSQRTGQTGLPILPILGLKGEW